MIYMMNLCSWISVGNYESGKTACLLAIFSAQQVFSCQITLVFNNIITEGNLQSEILRLTLFNEFHYIKLHMQDFLQGQFNPFIASDVFITLPTPLPFVKILH